MDRVVAQGDLRPMADNRAAMADLKAILANREAIYSRADWAVETSDRDVDATIAELVRLLPP
jgi:XRE family aerobic/anaerobic benzoate catabolism transcriptional regulator